MKVWMLTQGEYSSYEVVALFTTRDLAKEYATVLSIKNRERQIGYSRVALERFDREGSSYDENTIKVNWEMWVRNSSLEHAENAAKEIRDKRRGTLVLQLEHAEKPLVMKESSDHTWYGIYGIEEQELWDVVPVVPSDE